MAKKVTTEDFIKKAKLIHGEKYCYDNVEYIKNSIKVDIICNIHGTFSQTPANHLAGSGCSSCKFDDKKLSLNDFLLKANKIHSNRYDYSLVKYINARTKVDIICTEHGTYSQTPDNHISKKQGCPVCTKNKKYTTADFIKKSKEIHGCKYDYSLVNYINTSTHVDIICPKHGMFKQSPKNHFITTGCSQCSYEELQSKACKDIEQLIKSFNYIKEYRFNDCKNVKQLPFDFYIEDFNLCIEYDGEQHFKPIEHWGGEESHQRTVINDSIKNNYCNDNNINLLRISYNEDHIKVLKEYFKTKFNIIL